MNDELLGLNSDESLRKLIGLVVGNSSCKLYMLSFVNMYIGVQIFCALFSNVFLHVLTPKKSIIDNHPRLKLPS